MNRKSFHEWTQTINEDRGSDWADEALDNLEGLAAFQKANYEPGSAEWDGLKDMIKSFGAQRHFPPMWKVRHELIDYLKQSGWLGAVGMSSKSYGHESESPSDPPGSSYDPEDYKPDPITGQIPTGPFNPPPGKGYSPFRR